MERNLCSVKDWFFKSQKKTLDCTINYHASPKSNDVLNVEGKLIKQTRKIGTYLFDVYTEIDGSRTIIATMLSTLYRTGKPHDPNLEVG